MVVLLGSLLVGIARSAVGQCASTGVAVVLLGLLLVGFQPAMPASAGADDCPPPVPTVTFAGRWQGTVDYPVLPGDPQFQYDLVATIADDGMTASAIVDYPTLLCTATWTQTARSGSTVTFLEKIDPPFNPLDCVDDGVITVTLSGAPLGSTLDWAYAYSTGPGPFDQDAVLYPL